MHGIAMHIFNHHEVMKRGTSLRKRDEEITNFIIDSMTSKPSMVV